MVDYRSLRRSEARKRRVMDQLGSDRREFVKHLRVGAILDQMKLILADDAFNTYVYTHGIQSVPELLTRKDRAKDDTLDRSLDFVVCWRFFSPFLYDPVTAAILDTRWPGFSLEMRDIFISIVADGPFPHDLRGRPPRSI